jgi:hypothetical protein
MGEETTFRAEVRLSGRTSTGVPVPVAVVEALGAGKRPPVRVTLDDRYTYRSSVAAMGGEYLVPLSAEHRDASGVGAGDVVQVHLELDTDRREVKVPTDLALALEGHPEAKAFFEELSFSHQQWYVLPIEQAKKPETRHRRVEKALALLKDKHTP